MLLFILLSCASPQPVENHGWQETPSPRPDLQCWRRWNRDETIVCAPSLASTHGANQ